MRGAPMSAKGGAKARPVGREAHSDAPRVSMRAGIASRPELITIPLFFVVVVLLWQGIVGVLGVPSYILPSPSMIAGALWGQFSSDIFWNNLRVTATEAFLAYIVSVTVAFGLGLLISQIRIVEKTLLPYLVGFQSIPHIALAPLFVLWFGFGMTSKVVMGAVICFFPMLVNVIAGLRASGSDEIDMLRSFDASRRHIFMKVQMPRALPFIFAGLDVGIVFSVIGAVVGEFVGAKAGLGNQLLHANYNFDTAGLFATLVVLAFIGIAGHLIIVMLRRRFAFWDR